jgi:uncharacterized protein YqjF (DUF2071 family)
VELDDFQGKHLVSLVGFMFVNTRLFGVPIPFLGNFEEVNLRFYVKRKTMDGWQRGVVFVNESVPYAVVAWLANALYKEHYTSLKTWHRWAIEHSRQTIAYGWQKEGKAMGVEVIADLLPRPMEPGSEETFIFEHYFGYTRVSETKTLEYKVNHPSWLVFKVDNYKIDCDFAHMYGEEFSTLNQAKPSSVFLAEGSEVTVSWKRVSI